MHPVSPQFMRAIRQSGRRRTVCDVYFDGYLVATDLAVSDGSIRVELDGQVRRSGSITIADPRLVPSLSKTLSPLGTEIRVRQGVVYPNGTEELVPLGIFRLDITDWDELAQVPSIQIYDRSKALYASLPSPHSRSGQMAQDVVCAFIEWFYPSLAPLDKYTLFPGLNDFRLPGGHVFESDNHWEPIVDLARSMGGNLYFDVNGLPKCDPIVDISTNPPAVFSIDAGQDGVLVSARRSHSREGVYNGVQVVGAAQTNGRIPRASIFNTDPGSPLRYGGPFGKTGIIINDSSLTTAAQCSERAKAELAKYTGLAYSIDFSSLPNPALEAGDVIEFVYPDGTAEIHELSSLNIPLGAGDFTGSSKGRFLHG